MPLKSPLRQRYVEKWVFYHQGHEWLNVSSSVGSAARRKGLERAAVAVTLGWLPHGLLRDGHDHYLGHRDAEFNRRDAQTNWTEARANRFELATTDGSTVLAPGHVVCAAVHERCGTVSPGQWSFLGRKSRPLKPLEKIQSKLEPKLKAI